MPVATSSFQLIKKTALTHDVWELDFTSESAPVSLPGQYIMFVLPSGLRRSYSIAWREWPLFRFIIKRLDETQGGGKGSREICDLELGALVNAMGPLGHFTLSQEGVAKCFIGTGTGFAPLYYQIRACRNDPQLAGLPLALIYGVRSSEDMFYGQEIAELFPHGGSEKYLSREEKEGCKKGHVTSWIASENIAPYREFYLCGSPLMVRDARARLEALWVEKSQIRFEQF